MSDTIEFELRKDDEFIPLDKLLKVTRVCDSGGQARYRVAEGDVRVDGEVELRKRAKIRAGQSVEIDTTRIRVRDAGEAPSPTRE